jgi:prepilin peptidase CpaA
VVTPLPISVAVILVALVLTAAIWDLRLRRIPNWLSLAGIICGIALNSFLYGLAGLKQSLGGMALAFGVYFLLYLMRAMGAGDVKLMAAVGAFVGPNNWFLIFLITAVLGGAIALVVLAWRKRLRKTFDNVSFIVLEMMHFRAPYMGREELSVKSQKAFTLPHGAVIGLGCIVFLSWPLVSSTIH